MGDQVHTVLLGDQLHMVLRVTRCTPVLFGDQVHKFHMGDQVHAVHNSSVIYTCLFVGRVCCVLETG